MKWGRFDGPLGKPISAWRARYRMFLLACRENLGIPQALIQGETVDEEWACLEILVRHYLKHPAPPMD